MKLTNWLICCAIIALTITACDDTTGAYPPTYAGFSYSPSSPKAGDSLTITAVQRTKGHYLNKCSYAFSMTLKVYDDAGNPTDSTFSQSISTNYDGTDNSDPTWTLRVPDNVVGGTYSCSFTANWSNSADGELGTYVSQNDGSYSGSITATCYVLYTTATGSFRLTIKE